MRYFTEPRESRYVKSFGFLFLTKEIAKCFYDKYSYVGKSVEISKERHVSPGKSNPIFH